MGTLQMISRWRMPGKGIAFADLPVVPAVPCPREPMDWLSRRSAVQDSSMVLASCQPSASPSLTHRTVERDRLCVAAIVIAIAAAAPAVSLFPRDNFSG